MIDLRKRSGDAKDKILVADGTLSARVAGTLRLEDWKEAFVLTQGEREGKVVFVFDEQPS